MPRLIRLYLVNVAIGFALALAFVALLLWVDIAHLRHLVLETRLGWLAGVMMVVGNGMVFSGVQFGIAVMLMAEDEGTPPGGKRQRVVYDKPLHVAVAAGAVAAGQKSGGNRGNRGDVNFPRA